MDHEVLRPHGAIFSSQRDDVSASGMSIGMKEVLARTGWKPSFVHPFDHSSECIHHEKFAVHAAKQVHRNACNGLCRIGVSGLYG